MPWKSCALFEEVHTRIVKDSRFFIVITELALRAQRDPAINKIGKERDRLWERRLTGILEHGIADGSFRKDISIKATALA
jgi:hypothetical protein